MPLSEDLGVAYQTYFTHVDAGSREPAGSFPRALKAPLRALRRLVTAVLGIAQERERLACMYLHDQAPGRLLELGAGDGTRLALMRSRGWTVEGQDVDPQAGVFRLRAEGVTVYQGTLETLALPGGVYDAIVMNHVIEHVPDPIAVLRDCVRLLKPGGSTIVVTPNNRSLGARLFGSSWLALEPPRHLHLFNHATLKRLAEVAGYDRARVWTTAANADGVAVGSLSIRRRGRFVLEGGASSPVESAAGALVQFGEAALLRIAPDLGEECVLTAWK